MNLEKLAQTAVSYLSSSDDSNPPTKTQVFLEVQSLLGHIANSLKGLKGNSYSGWIYNLKPEGLATNVLEWELAHLLYIILIDYHYYSKVKINQKQLNDFIDYYDSDNPSVITIIANLVSDSSLVKLQALSDLCRIFNIKLSDVVGTFTMIFDKDYKGE